MTGDQNQQGGMEGRPPTRRQDPHPRRACPHRRPATPCRALTPLQCIVEEFIEGQGKQSPSIQGIVHSDGSVDLISTHEQVLGGADDQVYLGCRFPCDEAYRLKLHEYGLQVAKSLSEKGARGRFGVDFIAAPEKPWDFENWDIYALEINLRQGGTTHPFETMHLLTQGYALARSRLHTLPRAMHTLSLVP